MRTLPAAIVFRILMLAGLGASQPPATSAEKMLEAATYRADVLGDLPGAIEQLNAIIGRYPGKPISARALMGIGQAEERLGHADKARDAYIRIMREYPQESLLVASARHVGSPHEASWIRPPLLTSPAARCCMGAAEDPVSRSMIFFGGFTPQTCLGDTWMWRNGWRRLSPRASPSARSGPGMIYDAAARNVILFGGIDGAGKTLNDTWTWDGNTWTQRFPSQSPTSRRFDGRGMAYDPVSRKVLLFGGLRGHKALGDTWMWDGLAATWTEQHPSSAPSARRTMMAYDEAGKKLILFGGDAGGALSDDTFFGDTWSWGGSTWSRLLPANSPSPRGESAFAYDDRLGSLVLFGGVTGKGRRLSDTWLWRDGNWTEIHPVTLPDSRCAASMAYDPITHVLLLFGGYGTATRNDTWMLVPLP